MNWIILLILAIIVSIIAYYVMNHGDKSNSSEQNNKSINQLTYYPYEKKMLLTKTEYAFYMVLKRKCDENNLLICPKVRMEDFLNVTDRNNILKFRGYIKSRHIDFMICDDKLRLLAGLELDDRSHQNKNAADVDNFKNKVFETVNMPLFRVNTSPESYESQLDSIMKNIININRSNANHMAKR